MLLWTLNDCIIIQKLCKIFRDQCVGAVVDVKNVKRIGPGLNWAEVHVMALR